MKRACDNPVIADIPRHKPSNPRGYDKLTIARRKRDLEAMGRHYPDCNPFWLELVWDFHESKTPEEINKIIEDGVFEAPPTIKRETGGVIDDAVSVTKKTPEEMEWTRCEGQRIADAMEQELKYGNSEYNENEYGEEMVDMKQLTIKEEEN